MKNINQLRDLLKHEIHDLYSAEEQIIEALPIMIDKAKDRQLKKTLQEHVKVTEAQKTRLDEVLLKLDEVPGTGEPGKKSNGFLSGLFSGSSKQTCKGMEGLIKEGNKIMAEDMQPDVMDAAITAAAQKIEHYEISAYGTVRAYAQELELTEIEKLLKATLDEEYQADELLNELAIGRLNKEAIRSRRGRTSGRKKRTVSAAKKKSTGGRAASGRNSRKRSKTKA